MDSLEQLIDQELLNAIQEQLNQQPPPTTTDLPLDPLLSSIQHQPERSSTTTAVTPQPPPPPRLPRLPKSKLIQCAQLAIAAQQALDGVWEALQLANHSNDKLKISRNLDRQFGELHGQSLTSPINLAPHHSRFIPSQRTSLCHPIQTRRTSTHMATMYQQQVSQISLQLSSIPRLLLNPKS